MSFVSLPHDFDVRTGECRGYQIALQSEGDLIPVGFLRGDSDLPCDLRKLAENFTSVLNGSDPLYSDAKAHDMYYERHAGGLNFRFRLPNAEGVTKTGAMFTILPGVELKYVEH